jgi:hypothetical protein
MRYLSDEWKAAEWKNFEETVIGDDDSDCGGAASYDGYCGGCARCLRMQFGYYMMKEEERARVFLAAGFKVAPEGMIRIDWMPGYGGHHDSYNCKMSGERESFSYPWEKHNA